MSFFSQFKPKFSAANLRYFVNDQYTLKNYIKCDGSNLSKTTHPILFSKIGNLPSNEPTAVTTITSGTGNTLRKIIYANGLYVVAGDGGELRTSTNGTNWTGRTSGTGSTIFGLVYGNGVYVISGNGGMLRYSTNAINWTAITSGTTSTINCLAYNVGLFAYAGLPGSAGALTPFGTSTDGINWTAISSDPYSFGSLDLKISDTGFFRLYCYTKVGFQNATYLQFIETLNFPPPSGRDLEYIGTFTSVTPVSIGTFTDIKFTDGSNRLLYSAFGNTGPTFKRNKIAHLLDNFQIGDFFDFNLDLGTEIVRKLVYQDNLYVCATDSTSNIRTSTNGLHWTTRSIGSLPSSINDVLVHNDSIFVVGSGGGISRMTKFTHNTSTEYQLPSTLNFTNNYKLNNQFIENLTTYIKTK
jgi:hypothetical protein